MSFTIATIEGGLMAWSTVGYIHDLEEKNKELREQISQQRVKIHDLEHELQLLRNKGKSYDKEIDSIVGTCCNPK
jgi:FtsZ-binding cell division protein ZapB